MFRIAGLFALLMLSSLPVSAQSSIDDCEKIQQADAYNKCLAQFGPMRGQRAARPAGKKYGGHAARGGRHGRVRASFKVRRHR
ncbi:MAG TPA: hypothetical protein VFE89_03270 [Beijerinckiaceae bacterium]|jgi:hypothetical protein|nr:hypothetical protein [Beijerinckiaceae bacterium]